MKSCSTKHLQKTPFSHLTLSRCGGEAIRAFSLRCQSCSFKSLSSLMQPPCFTSSWGDRAGIGDGEGATDLARRHGGGSSSTAPLALLLRCGCHIHALRQGQLNTMPTALSPAFGCRKWPLYVVLSPVKLIMTQIGVAPPASELDGFSGSHSAPNTPGSSGQAFTVASGGTACLDSSRTTVLLPLLIFEQCVCQLR